MSATKEERHIPHLFKVVALSSVGSGLEMYDFVIYIFFAPYIAKQFFPTTNILVSLLLAFSVFAVGFLCRVLGAILFGHMGDTVGRKKSLIYTVITMAIPMIVLTFLPTYDQIGFMAPVLLTLMRCLQGLAVGGEFSGALTLVSEYAPPKKRGFICSLIILSLNAGILLASLISLVIQKIVIEDGEKLWGWRIGLFIGCILAVLIAILRRGIDETPAFQQLVDEKKTLQMPVIKLFTEKTWGTITLIGSMIGPALAVGMLMFLPTYLENFSYLHQSVTVFINNSLFLVILCSALPFFGKLSDFLGRKPIFITGLGGIALFIYPIARWLSTAESHFSIFWPLFFLAILISMVLSVFGTILSENFPTRLRASGIGIAYNLPFAIITGTFPMVSIAIYRHTQSLTLQYVYIIVLSLISIGFIYFSNRNRNHSQL